MQNQCVGRVGQTQLLSGGYVPGRAREEMQLLPDGCSDPPETQTHPVSTGNLEFNPGRAAQVSRRKLNRRDHIFRCQGRVGSGDVINARAAGDQL